MRPPAWASADADIECPSAARIYDAYLGGFHNFAVDREVAERLLRVFPHGAVGAQVNRAFLRRTVEFCVRSGITQFLELGSGIPTYDHVHEVAQRVDPRCRVVYVDIDPVTAAHGRCILDDNPRAVFVQSDLREPGTVLADPELRELLDLRRPVAVLMVTVPHFLTDFDSPVGIVAGYRQHMAPGSALVLSHPTGEGRLGSPDARRALADLFERSGVPAILRSRRAVEALFGGFDLVEPGVVWIERWRPGTPDRQAFRYSYGGVGFRR